MDGAAQGEHLVHGNGAVFHGSVAAREQGDAVAQAHLPCGNAMLGGGARGFVCAGGCGGHGVAAVRGVVVMVVGLGGGGNGGQGGGCGGAADKLAAVHVMERPLCKVGVCPLGINFRLQ